MPLESRVPTRAELPDYYRVLPFANGLPWWEPANAAWHGGPEPWPPMRPPAGPQDLDRMAAENDPAFHPVAAFEGTMIVGASAMLSMEVTLPGGRPLPAGGVTSTGVLATHRRRGALRSMMQLMFEQALERGEPLSLLSAGEAGIYGNFDFHPVTYRHRYEIQRHQAVWKDAPSDHGALALVGADEAKQMWPVLHAEIRTRRVGELSPQTGRWDGFNDLATDTNGSLRYLVHRDQTGTVDGLANFRLPWGATEDTSGVLIIEALEAKNSFSYRALLGLLLDFDLTKRVVMHTRSAAEPLRWMLKDPRALRITRQSDNLWARILDLPTCLTAREYCRPGTLTLAVADAMLPTNEGTWRLAVDEDLHATLAVVDVERPDLTLGIAALSGLYLGGNSANELAEAGLIRAQNHGSLTQFAQMLHVDPPPHNSFAF